MGHCYPWQWFQIFWRTCNLCKRQFREKILCWSQRAQFVFDQSKYIVCGNNLFVYPACIKFGFHWTDFREIRYWDFAKICRATPDVVKMGLKDAGMENQVLLYCWQQYETYCDSTVVRRERIVAFAWQHWTLCLVDSYIQVNNSTKGTHCYASVATTMRTRHNVTLFVDCFSLSLSLFWVDLFFLGHCGWKCELPR